MSIVTSHMWCISHHILIQVSGERIIYIIPRAGAVSLVPPFTALTVPHPSVDSAQIRRWVGSSVEGVGGNFSPRLEREGWLCQLLDVTCEFLSCRSRRPGLPLSGKPRTRDPLACAASGKAERERTRLSEESVMSSSVRDITESTEAEGRDDTHHGRHARYRSMPNVNEAKHKQ